VVKLLNSFNAGANADLNANLAVVVYATTAYTTTA
jgi:hypothetical protein